MPGDVRSSDPADDAIRVVLADDHELFRRGLRELQGVGG
jgi:hypothetical protein